MWAEEIVSLFGQLLLLLLLLLLPLLLLVVVCGTYSSQRVGPLYCTPGWLLFVLHIHSSPDMSDKRAHA